MWAPLRGPHILLPLLLLPLPPPPPPPPPIITIIIIVEGKQYIYQNLRHLFRFPTQAIISLQRNLKIQHTSVGPSGRAVERVSLRPLARRDCGSQSRWGHGFLSAVSVVCCQEERSLRRADHSSRVVLLTVVRRCL